MMLRSRSSLLWALVILLAVGSIFAVTMALSPSIASLLLGGASLIAVIDLFTNRSRRNS